MKKDKGQSKPTKQRVVSYSIPLELVDEIKRRAKLDRRSSSAFVTITIQKQFNYADGE
jgi:hypothetical protein